MRLCSFHSILFACMLTPAPLLAQETTTQDDEIPPSMRARVQLLDEAFPFDEEHPAAGNWHGNVMTSFGAPAGSLDITLDDAGNYRLTATVAPGNRPQRRISNFLIDGRAVQFSFPLDPPEAGMLRFNGEVSTDGQRMRGEVFIPDAMIDRDIQLRESQRARAGEPPLTVDERERIREQSRHGTFEFGRTPRPIDLPEPRAFTGQIQYDENIAFEITLVFAETPEDHIVGHIDIPAHAIAGWRLDRVVREGDRIVARMGGGSVATYDGAISEDGSVYSGVYKQGEFELPFEFARVDDYTLPEFDEVKVLGGIPFRTNEVTIEHAEAHFLSGTLAVPRTAGLVPAVVLVSAQGPHDRRNTIYGHHTFDVIADFLVRRGIAVLRYDDRGVGQSSGRFQGATVEDFASDALTAYNFLKSIDRIDPSRIGFIGHGEGATAAALAASRADDPAFVVGLGGYGVPGWKLEVARAGILYEQQGVAEDVRARYLDALRGLYVTFVDDNASDDELFEAGVRWAEAERAAIAAVGGRVSQRSPEQQAAQRIAVMRQGAREFFLRYDPATAYRAANCPIFAVWGSLDFSAPPDDNLPPLQRALADTPTPFTGIVYAEMNHLFQPAKTGLPGEYRKSAISMHEDVLATVVDWITKMTSPRANSDDEVGAGRFTEGAGGATRRAGDERTVIGD